MKLVDTMYEYTVTHTAYMAVFYLYLSLRTDGLEGRTTHFGPMIDYCFFSRRPNCVFSRSFVIEHFTLVSTPRGFCLYRRTNTLTDFQFVFYLKNTIFLKK